MKNYNKLYKTIALNRPDIKMKIYAILMCEMCESARGVVELDIDVVFYYCPMPG